MSKSWEERERGERVVYLGKGEKGERFSFILIIFIYLGKDYINY